MGPPQPARGGINIQACARPIAVDHRISLPYNFRIAGTLLRQVKIYRDEKNLLDLYVILLRYSILLCKTIPKHRDYHTFMSREVEFFKNATHNSSNAVKFLAHPKVKGSPVFYRRKERPHAEDPQTNSTDAAAVGSQEW